MILRYLTHIYRNRSLHVGISVFILLFATPNVAFAIFDFVGNAILSAVGFFTGLAGMLLNSVFIDMVLGMGELYERGLGKSVEDLWSVIRDICNLAFLFGLIFVGFQTILNAGGAATKKTLVSIIIGALLINFSLFFTQVVVDTSNVLANAIYDEFKDRPGSDETALFGLVEYGIAGTFMEALGLDTFLSNDRLLSGGELNTALERVQGTFTFFFSAMIFLLVAAFVFAAGAILLIIRFVALTLIMIFSPFLFAGMVFPQTQKYAKDLFSKLLGYSFFAPLYLLLVLFSLVIIEGARNIYGIGTKSFSGILNETAINSFPIILNFTLGIILLIASLVLAKSISVAGASKATNMLQGAGKRIQGAAGRHTIGRASSWGATANDKLEESRWGRNFKRGISVLSLGAFDEQARRSTFKAGQENKFGGSTSRKEKADFKKKRENEIDRSKNLQADIKAFKEAEAKAGNNPDEYVEKTGALAKRVAGISGKEIDAMGVKFVSEPHIAMNLTASQIQHIEKSEEFTESQVAEVKEARKKALNNLVNPKENSAAEQQLQRLFRQKPGVVAALPADILKLYATKVPVAALSKAYMDDSLSSEEQAAIRKKIEDASSSVPAIKADRTEEHEKIIALNKWLEENNIGRQFGR